MKREDAYILAAPVFATYLSQASAPEALRYTSQAFSEVDEKIAREMFIAGLMPNPGSRLAEDRLPIVRQFGYAASQEEAGTPKDVLVATFLQSVYAVAVGKVQAAMERFNGIYSGTLAIMTLPLFLLFVYALGVMDISVEMLLLLIGGLGALSLTSMYLVMPRDFSAFDIYGVAFAAALVAGTIAVLIAWTNGLPLSLGLIVAGAILTIWLKATGRMFWYRIAYEVPAMLRDFASRVMQGMPTDLAFRESASTYKTARYVIYNYDIPSTMFKVAKAMYRAITWAGPNLQAINFLQSYLDENTKVIKKVSDMTLAFVAMYLGALFVILYALAVLSGTLQEVATSAVTTIISPKLPEELQHATAQIFSVMTGIFIFAAFITRGAWLGLTLGGITGSVIYYVAQHLYQMWLPLP